MAPFKPLPSDGYLDWKAEQDEESSRACIEMLPVEQMQERAREASDHIVASMIEEADPTPEPDPIQQIRERNRLAEDQKEARQARIDKIDPIDRARRGLEETK